MTCFFWTKYYTILCSSITILEPVLREKLAIPSETEFMNVKDKHITAIAGHSVITNHTKRTFTTILPARETSFGPWKIWEAIEIYIFFIILLYELLPLTIGFFCITTTNYTLVIISARWFFLSPQFLYQYLLCSFHDNTSYLPL